MHRGRPASIQGSISDDKSSKNDGPPTWREEILGLHNQPIVAEAIQALPKFGRNLLKALTVAILVAGLPLLLGTK